MSKLMVAALLLGALFSLPAAAQLEELENPGKVAAVQPRPYRMHHELSLAVGLLPLDAFYKNVYGQVQYAYHFTDEFAWQVGRGAYGYNIDTGLRRELETTYGVLPTTIDQIQYFVGSDLMWTPFFGKFALLNKALLYFDAHLILGVTVFKFTNAFRAGINVGGGVRLFQSKYVSFRLDCTDNVVLTEKPFQVMTVQLVLALNFSSR